MLLKSADDRNHTDVKPNAPPISATGRPLRPWAADEWRIADKQGKDGLDMEPAPAVSVLMAVHNGQDFLVEAIDSILRQTFTDFEFLIIDDGSTDGSAAILKDYAARDPRVLVTTQANQGLTKSLNVGAGLARGELIARLRRTDDVSLPERFQRQVDALRADSALVLIGSGVELITEDGLPLGTRGHATGHEEIRRELLLGNGDALSHPAVMMRRTALESVGGYDESFAVAQDLDLFLRLSEAGRVDNLPETLLLWRQHPSSVNRTRTHLWADVKARAIEKTIGRVGAGEFARTLFYRADTLPDLHNALSLGTRAEANGRYRTAARLYARALREPGRRGVAAVRIARLSVKRALRYLRR